MASTGDVARGPTRIVVVDDDPNIRMLIEKALSLPEFEVHGFADARDALMKLHDLRPDLIVSDVLMPDMDGRTFFRVVKRSEQLKDVPFIFLSGIHSNEEAVAALDGGADDFVNKPFNINRLVAKVRATLRMAGRLAAVEQPPGWLAGTVGEVGTLPLVKFCEDKRLTGRLTVESGGKQRWADFKGGELVQAGSSPETPGEDPLDALLSIEGGTYLIQQKPLDAVDLKEAEARVRAQEPSPAAAIEDGPPPIPGGRLSKVEVRGRAVEIQTEGENRPHFTVTTVLVREGQVLRKVETSWQHPLQRREDEELARSQIDRQHDRVVAMIRELTVEAPRRTGAALEKFVDGSVLAWAISFIAEQARESLGSVMTVTLLRRTHKAISRTNEHLRSFRISEDGRVVAAEPQLPRGAVEAAATWCASFLAEAATLVQKIGGLRVRQSTRMMEADLEKIGFYEAFDEAAGVRVKPA